MSHEMEITKMTKLITAIILSLLFSTILAHWECINHNTSIIPTCNTWRWEVPGGWLVSTDNGDNDIAMIFYPDASHQWSLK